ncbi:TenA family transcriptional regulator [Streptomyces violascens]|uniref:Iron-containing redox enzyme family protein n=1 Tax=Streptomyces violascens TaxID=67381 RepID=A0ABQ3QRL9_9ACTN|nr:iron-containing redox enzyme family protein [Streptomyces violascens]GGU48395.1 hypothetical protein GCM10010289_81150 [Streptomyces violascens]GHI39909.1 hypothetical protein Sviol_43170 [Streptomyces violascens]
MTQLIQLPLSERLEMSEARQRFVANSFFRGIQGSEVTVRQAVCFLGQWWHPLHYFPTFLARCVAVLPDIKSKSAITRILDQEVGNGKPGRAHESIYVESMTRAGFDREAVVGAAPLPATSALLRGYERLSGERLTALGGIYATEVTDLLMVSSIGTAVEKASGERDNAWVAIHVEQEPDHVEEAGHTLMEGFTEADEDQVVAAADEMWRLWSGFFDQLVGETGLGR